MVYTLDPDDYGFPSPEEAEEDGLLAIGGDMAEERVLSAYVLGVFPWFVYEGKPFWFSPDPRMVLKVEDFVPSKSLQRTIRSGRFEVRVDTRFTEVMRHCAETPRNDPDNDGTWITDEFIRCYSKLHTLGFAHSFETYLDGELVGGLYGVSIGDFFCGESMFHRVTDASKVAFCKLMEWCKMHNFRFVDAQQETPHLASLGARPIPRKDYLSMLKVSPWELTLKYFWTRHSVVLLMGGNEGETDRFFFLAMEYIGNEIGRIGVVSDLYKTAPWGNFGDEKPNDFYNLGIVVDTELSAHEVLRKCLSIESKLGRVRMLENSLSEALEPPTERVYSSRPIDIDMIFFDSECINSVDLQVPHPRMQYRRFVLEPIAQMIPHFVHPLLKKTMEQLRDECSDTNTCQNVGKFIQVVSPNEDLDED